VFTQTDPWSRPAGSTAEAGYVYTGNNPMGFIDLSGMCRQSSLRRLNPIVRMDSTPPTTVAGGKTDCSSLFADMIRLVQAVRTTAGQGTQGLETRWLEMMRDGVKGGRASFDRHVGEFISQQRGGGKKPGGLLKKWNQWLKDCDDPDDPPSSIEVRQLQKIEEWTTVQAPTWKEVNDALVLSQKNYESTNGSAGPRPTGDPISIPWRRIALGAGMAVAGGALIIAAGLYIAEGGSPGGGLAWPGPPA
jgi:hypothetical protein